MSLHIREICKYIEDNLDDLSIEYKAWMETRCTVIPEGSKLWEIREIIESDGECSPMQLVVRILGDRATKRYADLLIAERGEGI